MRRRRQRAGVGALVREIRAQGDRIVTAIQRASDEARSSREEMSRSMLEQGAHFLRLALDEAAPRAVTFDAGSRRTVTIGPPVANDAGAPDAPPESGRR
ncbi:MAG: hypothetical protein QM820_49390 [Minicystis sp.]